MIRVASWEDESGRGCRMLRERSSSFNSVEKVNVLLEEEESWTRKTVLKLRFLL